MRLRVEPVTFRCKGRRAVQEIYTSSFQKKERMPFWLMLLMAKTRSTEFLAFYEDQTLCGFVYMASNKKLSFIMFFAVAEAIRSQGYGSRILDEIEALHPGKKLILSIERCDAAASDIELRKRRKRFYLRNGYAESGSMMELVNIKQEILIKNGTFDQREFSHFFWKYSNGTTVPKIWKTS